MPPPTVTILVGLPGSGKTRFLKEKYSARPDLVFDDFHKEAVRHSDLFTASRNYPDLRDKLREGCDCIIADIAYCLEHRLLVAQAGIQLLAAEIGIPVIIRLLYFANDPGACRHNVVHRFSHDSSRNYLAELKNIDEFTLQYHPPAAAMPVHSCCCEKRLMHDSQTGTDISLPNSMS